MYPVSRLNSRRNHATSRSPDSQQRDRGSLGWMAGGHHRRSLSGTRPRAARTTRISPAGKKRVQPYRPIGSQAPIDPKEPSSRQLTPVPGRWPSLRSHSNRKRRFTGIPQFQWEWSSPNLAYKSCSTALSPRPRSARSSAKTWSGPHNHLCFGSCRVPN